MNSIEEHVSKRLPEVDTMKHVWGEAEKYGASYLVARRLQYRYVPATFVSWNHGWVGYCKEMVDPYLLTTNYTRKKDTVLVTKKYQKEKLKKDFGYKNVYAVGLPFIYTTKKEVERIEDSLLVMPPHTVPGAHNKWNKDIYLDKIVGYKEEFDKVVVCLHYNDVKKGDWTKKLESIGVGWITGARVDDKNALTRMRLLFSMFENVTTAAIGSHVWYANYCGCKVSIHGPYFSIENAGLESEEREMSKNPELLNTILESLSEKRVKNKYSFLFEKPKKAKNHKSKAKKELGSENKKSLKELSHLLGWNMKSQLYGYSRALLRKINTFIYPSLRL